MGEDYLAATEMIVATLKSTLGFYYYFFKKKVAERWWWCFQSCSMDTT